MERTIDLTLETNSLESIIKYNKVEKTLTSQMEKKIPKTLGKKRTQMQEIKNYNIKQLQLYVTNCEVAIKWVVF